MKTEIKPCDGTGAKDHEDIKTTLKDFKAKSKENEKMLDMYAAQALNTYMKNHPESNELLNRVERIELFLQSIFEEKNEDSTISEKKRKEYSKAFENLGSNLFG